MAYRPGHGGDAIVGSDWLSQALWVTPVEQKAKPIKFQHKEVFAKMVWPAGGAEPGQPPDVSQHHASEASGKGHIRLGCVTRFKVPPQRSGASGFLSVLLRPNQRVQAGLGTPLKRGHAPRRHAYYVRQGWRGCSAVNSSGS